MSSWSLRPCHRFLAAVRLIVRPLPWDEQLALLASDPVPLELRRVVRNVVDLMHPEVRRILPEDVRKYLPDPVQDDLAVDEGHVDGALHGGEIILPLRRSKRGARQPPVA